MAKKKVANGDSAHIGQIKSNGKKVVTIAEETIKPIVEEFGYELIDVEYEKKVNGFNLSVTIDKEGGVDINDCEKVHKAIDEPLDSADPTNGEPYILNVSSYGIDRPLKKEVDFKKNLGHEISIKFYAPYEGHKVIESCILKSYDDTTMTIELSGAEITINKDLVALAQPVIRF